MGISYSSDKKDSLSLLAGILLAIIVTAAVAWLLLFRKAGGSPSNPYIRMLPAVNALLNACCALLLSAGYLFILKKKIIAHRNCMLSAFLLSSLFLISYVIYHYHAGSKPYTGEGILRRVYFFILISHILLAVLIIPLALISIPLGLRRNIPKHRRIARWTLPVWLYVSITGVVVYLMLY